MNYLSSWPNGWHANHVARRPMNAIYFFPATCSIKRVGQVEICPSLSWKLERLMNFLRRKIRPGWMTALIGTRWGIIFSPHIYLNACFRWTFANRDINSEINVRFSWFSFFFFFNSPRIIIQRVDTWTSFGETLSIVFGMFIPRSNFWLPILSKASETISSFNTSRATFRVRVNFYYDLKKEKEKLGSFTPQVFYRCSCNARYSVWIPHEIRLNYPTTKYNPLAQTWPIFSKSRA